MSFINLFQHLKTNENNKDFIEYLETNYIHINNKIKNHKKELEKLIDLQNKLTQQIIKLCSHNWIIDKTNCGEHTEWICSNCGTFKD